MKRLIEKIRENQAVWEDKTPCFMLDRTIVEDKLREFENNFNGEIAYSLKTNPHPEIIKTVFGRKHTFTVCSLEELILLYNQLGDVSKIIYLSPTLDCEEIETVLELGVRRLSLDSPSQVDLVDKHQGGLEEVFVRFSTAPQIKKEGFLYEKNSFLGMLPDDSLLQLEKLAKTSLNLGLHNHLSSQNTDIESWRQNLQLVYGLIRRANRKNIPLKSLNLGGGFPVSYIKPSPHLADISKIVKVYQQKIRDIYSSLSFIFEPGRYIVAESTALITKVKQKKRFNDRTILIVDASSYNSYMDTMLVGLELPCKAIPYNNRDIRTEQAYTIRGRSPCSLDILRRDVSLPEIIVGGYILFLNAGAYNFFSDFVNMEKPKTLIL